MAALPLALVLGRDVARAAVLYRAGAQWFDRIDEIAAGGMTTSSGDQDLDEHADGAHAMILHGFPEPVVGGTFRASTGEATAALGHLGAKSFAHMSIASDVAGAGLQYRFTASAEAEMIVDDLRFTGPAGATTVSTSVNLSVDGLVGSRLVLGVGDDGMNVYCYVGNVNVAYFAVGPQTQSAVPVGVDVHREEALILPNIRTYSSAVAGTFTTRATTVPLGQPQTLRLRLVIAQDILEFSYNTDVDVQLTGDASHTLALPSSGPIFNLPEGFTVNSDSGLIVDNQLVTTPTTVSTTTSTIAGTPTTTTTLPGGGCAGLDGIAAVDCACAGGVPAICAGLSLPTSVTSGFQQACATADAAVGAAGKRSRRLFAKASKKLGKLGGVVGKRKVAAKLSPPCVAGLKALFGDVRFHVDKLRSPS